MTDQSQTSPPATLPGDTKPTSSPEPEHGHMQLDLLDGPTTGHSGPAPARASRSARQGKDAELLISGIYGQTFIDSSALAVRPSLLANRLRERLGMIGSTESPLIWSAKVTPAKRLIFRLRPWTRRTSGKGSIGSQWRTPNTREKGGVSYQDPEKAQARLKSGHQINLQDKKVIAANWPTPQARDHFPPHKEEYIAKHKANGHGMSNLNDTMALSAWPTPTVADVQGGRKHRSGARSVEPLLNGLMHKAATEASGQTTNGSPATMEKRGAPNPAFAFWLMGYPDEFINGVSRATALLSRSRSKSSPRSRKA